MIEGSTIDATSILDIGTLYRHMERKYSGLQAASEYQIKHNTRIKYYPDGSVMEIMAANRQIFRESGWEAQRERSELDRERKNKRSDSQERARRRARAAVRDLCLCNRMSHFVTLTVSAEQANRYDIKEIVSKMRSWLDNRVRRKGLVYVLVPELHKDGAVHFHGLVNGALELSDSGTIIPPEGGKPQRPTSAAQREKWIESGGKIVYNILDWKLGFSTAIELYGEYERAVNYVCKYITKQDTDSRQSAEGEVLEAGSGKIGGRWYFSGGKLERPTVGYTDTNIEDVAAMPGAAEFEVPALIGVKIAACRM